MPGPDTERLGAAAKRNHLWVVASLSEFDGGRIYNTGVLLDRNGELKGKYRKVHLPLGEWKSGVVPGNEYPVFETEFGKVAIQICYDWFFPEIAGIWGLKGAEIVFAPTWGTTFPDEPGRLDGGETVFRLRAFDNGIYLVPSVYDGNSMVINPLGRILASSKGRTGVFWCEVDLNQREPTPDFGHWRAIVPATGCLTPTALCSRIPRSQRIETDVEVGGAVPSRRTRRQRSRFGGAVPPRRSRRQRSGVGGAVPSRRARRQRSGVGGAVPSRRTIRQRSGFGGAVPSRRSLRQGGRFGGAVPSRRISKSGMRASRLQGRRGILEARFRANDAPVEKIVPGCAQMGL